MEREITVYTKERCVQCDATERTMARYAIEYSLVSLDDNPNLVESFIEEGLMQAPIVDTGDEKWSGFRPDHIKRYAQN